MKTRPLISKTALAATPVLWFALAASAHATPTTYTDSASFFADLPGAASTLDFDSDATGNIADGGTVGGITFNYGTTGNNLADPNTGVSLTISDVFLTTSPDNFLGTSDGDLLQSGDDFSLAFAAANAIGMFLISADGLDPDGTCTADFIICDDDIVLSANGEDALLDIDAVEQTLADGSNVYFLGIIDDMSTFSSADISSTCCGLFFFNVDDITVATAEVQTPAPAPALLLGAGLVAAGFGARRRSWGEPRG